MKEDSGDVGVKRSKPALLAAIVKLLKPQESVQRALRRLGGDTGTARKWQLQKKKKGGDGAAPAEGLDLASFEELTGCADELCGHGYYDIYQATYEKLSYEVKQCREPGDTPGQSSTQQPQAAAAAAAVAASASEGGAAMPAQSGTSSGVMFHFKWSKDENAELFGPFSAEQMCEWQDQDYFKNGVFCREVGKAEFYDSKRIDFELYT